MLSEEKRSSLTCPALCPAAGRSWGAWELWDMAEWGITTPVPPGNSAASFAHKCVGNHMLPWELSSERGKPLTQLVPPLHPCLCSLPHCREGQKQNHKESLVPKEYWAGLLSRIMEDKQHTFVPLAVFTFKQHWRMWDSFPGSWKSPLHKAELTFPYRHEKREDC